jgi:acid phosphatase type 7
MKRRTFIGNFAAVAAFPSLGATVETLKSSAERFADFKVLSPPVIQNPTENSFSVSWRVGGKATGWVEWGTIPELGHRVRPAHHGLMGMSDYSLSARVTDLPEGADIFYRVVTMPIHYNNAYSIEKGAPIVGETRRLRLPRASAKTCSLVMVNDTHDHTGTVAALARRVNEIDPDVLIWNGDACDTFDHPEQVARICLSPGQHDTDPAAGGWASTRPLFFTLGNHDARGASARSMPEALTPWPDSPTDPNGLVTTPVSGGRYCFAKRIGPVALICLDTGEDKPDARDVWGGMAAYEPYREAQKTWLIEALKRPEIASAPYLLTICHIPLRGLPEQNDGMGETGYAGYSGFGQRLWMSSLIEAGCQMILSGHTHRHRIDIPDEQYPLYQVVGGGPKEEQARLVRIQADHERLRVMVEDLEKQVVSEVILHPRKL